MSVGHRRAGIGVGGEEISGGRAVEGMLLAEGEEEILRVGGWALRGFRARRFLGRGLRIWGEVGLRGEARLGCRLWIQ